MEKQTKQTNYKEMRDFQLKVLNEGWEIVKWMVSEEGVEQWEFQLMRGNRIVDGDGYTGGEGFVAKASKEIFD